MRIAHFTNTYYPVVSGVVRSISAFRQALTDQGHSVFIFSQHVSDYEDSEPFIFRYPAFELPLHSNFPVIIPVSPFIDRVLPSLKPQVIHAHHPVLLGQTAANKAEELGLPFVFTFHTRYREYSHYVSLNQVMVKEIIDRWLGVFIQQCHHIIVPSESIRQILKELYGLREQVTVIPTGIDLTPYETAVGDPIRQKHGWGNDRVLISVGRLAKEKNWHDLLTAVTPIMRSEPDVRLVILGEGEERKSLSEQAQELGIAGRVELPGAVPFDQIPAYLKAADLFCFASQSETQGLVTLEAMAAGLPIAAYDATGTSDVVVDGENGLLTADEPPALAQAIRRILTEDNLRQKLREGARRTAKEYEIGRQAGRLTAVYQQAIADQKANKLIQVDPQKPLLKDKWYELLGMEKNPLEVLRLGN